MEHEVNIVVKIGGQDWEFVNALYDRETGAFSWEDIKGNCSAYLPRELLHAIEAEGQRVADREEAERRVEEAMYQRYER